MSFQQLPPELLCAILSHLTADDDIQSLHACALTCRAFVSPAQANIFHTLSLSAGARDDVGETLTKLESTPHIRTFLKRLCLLEIHRPWIQRSEVLHDILGFLSQYVVSLEIEQRRRKPESPRFDFSSLAQLKFLEEISLKEDDVRGLKTTKYGDNALPTFLNHFPKLRAISLRGCWVQNETIDSISAIAAPIFRLERLDVWSCHDALLLDWLMPALSSLRKLHFLYLAPGPCISGTNVAQFMIKAGESLQHLEVGDLDDTSNADLQLLMTAVRTCASDLRSLDLEINRSANMQYDSAMQVLVQSLLHLGAHAHIQHLTIKLYQDDARVDGNPWDELQDILVGTRFPALRSVEFQLWMNSPDYIPMAIEPLAAAVPRLAKRTMISVCRGPHDRQLHICMVINDT